jgi:hypothetical protein
MFTQASHSEVHKIVIELNGDLSLPARILEGRPFHE